MTAAERQTRRRKRVGKSINRRRKTLRKLAAESEAKQAARQETQQRREASRAAQPLPDGFEFRQGDCREVLADIADNSVALILTDPPYEDGAEPLWRWLGSWALDVLIPSGSLICYFGGANINKLYRIFDDAGLKHYFAAWLRHNQSQRLGGKFVIAQGKPILWYVKAFRSGRTLVPNVVSDSVRDKSEHNWAQGDGGIWQWTEHLTVIVDPFCGTKRWGEITVSMGRRWIGADVEDGGATVVAA